MSRIGKKPVDIASGVKVKQEGSTVIVEGAKGKLEVAIPEELTVNISDKEVIVDRKNDTKRARAQHGLIRNLIKNAIAGVAEGYKKELDISGVGFKAELKGKKIVCYLGYSHEIHYEAPEGVSLTCPQPTRVVIQGIDNVKVGQTAARIRDFYKPEPYNGKGVSYAGEKIRRKQGKVVG